MHPNRLGSPKASTCSRDKSQCHYHWLFSLSQLSATFREFSLIPFSFSPSPAGFGELPLDQAHCLSGWTNPSWSWLPCSYSHSFHSSIGPSELSPVLRCGSLSLSPSIAGRRFYGDIQDSHQSDYRTRPVQAPSPPLPRVLPGDIP